MRVAEFSCAADREWSLSVVPALDPPVGTLVAQHVKLGKTHRARVVALTALICAINGESWSSKVA
jgi:hypothetical protein